MGTMKMSSQSLMTNCKCDFKHAVVPGWNDKVKDAYLIWRAIGKPRQGDVFNSMKLSRTKFKHAIRKCKRKTKKLLLLIVLLKRCVKKIPVKSGKMLTIV